MKNILDAVKDISRQIDGIDNIHEKIDILNRVRYILHISSPLKHHPVDFVMWRKSEMVEGNEYNPNNVAPPEQSLLEMSITKDGYTMPIVGYIEGFEEMYLELIKGLDVEDDLKALIIDGFHRRKSERNNPEISKSTFGYIPLTNIRNEQKDTSNRMASTIRHNRARGTHSIDLMKNIVAELVEAGMSDGWITKHIGMDKDEILRLKQLTGLQKLFKDHEFSKSWE